MLGVVLALLLVPRLVLLAAVLPLLLLRALLRALQRLQRCLPAAPGQLAWPQCPSWPAWPVRQAAGPCHLPLLLPHCPPPLPLVVLAQLQLLQLLLRVRLC